MKKSKQSGFSLMELVIVVAIAFIIMALAMPLIANALKNYRLRQAGADLANLLQQARMRAVQDDQYYAVLTPANSPSACLDLAQNLSSCTGSEPAVFFHSTIQFQSYSSAPGLTNLRSQYLPSTCGTNAACVSIDPNSTVGPVFGSRGLPCYQSGSTCAYTSTAAGINGAANAPVAFEVYMQNTQTSAWEAVTVSPAGRVREWYYDNGGSVWKALN